MIRLTLLSTGYCTHPEFILLRGGQRKSVPIPALVGLIQHPRLGPILFDTGYAPRFFTETRRLPYSLYAKITPVHLRPAETAKQQLDNLGIAAADVRYIIISHFHADHIAGLPDFPNATFIYFDSAYRAVRHRRGLKALRAGFLPGLLPPNFEQRSRPVDPQAAVPLSPEYRPFERGVALLGDENLLAAPLPGHAHGQMGLFLPTENLGPVLLAADACWHSRAYRQLVWPHPLANLVLADPQAYRQTLRRLHQLHRHNPNILIIPSHCREIAARFELGAFKQTHPTQSPGGAK